MWKREGERRQKGGEARGEGKARGKEEAEGRGKGAEGRRMQRGVGGRREG